MTSGLQAPVIMNADDVKYGGYYKYLFLEFLKLLYKFVEHSPIIQWGILYSQGTCQFCVKVTKFILYSLTALGPI